MYNQELYYSVFSPDTATIHYLGLLVKFVPTGIYVLLHTPLVIDFCGEVSEIFPLTCETLICPQLNQYSSKLLLLVPHFLKSPRLEC